MSTIRLSLILSLILFLCLSASCGSAPSTHTPVPTISETPTHISTQAPSPKTNQPMDGTQSQAPTETQISTPATSSMYTVKEGDTLWDIAQAYQIPMVFIALANDIVDINLIFPRQILVIPESSVTPPDISKTEKLIVVILSLQKTYPYENGKPIQEFIVSTGLPGTPTVLGSYSVYLKYELTRMTGPDYDLSDVPWTMYFYQGYGFHGTYWHNNFGHPMSHGCVNMKTDEAEWLYHWAPVGTSVLILP